MTVFANSLEVSSKAQGCKVIAAFPDTCFTPPQTPATPPGVPIPYPDFGVDSDVTSGSGTVKIGGKEISQESSSKFSKCSGDEAGAAPKKGVITSKNTGPIYAQKWSMDVKVEGKGVVRFGDIATSNHACNPGDSPPHPIVGKANLPPGHDDPNCLVGPYDEIVNACKKAEPPGEAHHVVPDKAFRTGTRSQANSGASVITRSFGGKKKQVGERIAGAPKIGEGVCICISKSAHKKVHKEERKRLNRLGRTLPKSAKTYSQKKAAVQSMKDAGTWGTAKLKDIVSQSKKAVESCPKDKNGRPTDKCIKKAKGAVNKQLKSMKASQIGRTNNWPPSEAGVSSMLT